MKTVLEHIEKHHGGNKAAFGRAVKPTPSKATQVQTWVNKGFIVTADGWIINPKTNKRAYD